MRQLVGIRECLPQAVGAQQQSVTAFERPLKQVCLDGGLDAPSALAKAEQAVMTLGEEAVRRGFVQYARAKGLAERAVLFRHVLPNAAIPIVTVLGLQTGYMLGGAIVVETIFTLPGVGRMTLDAVLERNYPVVQGTLLVIGAMFMLVNLVTDILYGVIDPRVRRR